MARARLSHTALPPLVAIAGRFMSTAEAMHGTALPKGLLESSQLPEPVFTPSTKAAVGGHDENISFEKAADLIGMELAKKLRDVSLTLYSRGAEWAAERGIIIADTKFELGRIPGTGELVLCPRWWHIREWVCARSLRRKRARPCKQERVRSGVSRTAE